MTRHGRTAPVLTRPQGAAALLPHSARPAGTHAMAAGTPAHGETASRPGEFAHAAGSGIPARNSGEKEMPETAYGIRAEFGRVSFPSPLSGNSLRPGRGPAAGWPPVAPPADLVAPSVAPAWPLAVALFVALVVAPGPVNRAEVSF